MIKTNAILDALLEYDVGPEEEEPVASGSILVIHPEDPSTYFLKDIYLGLDCSVVSEDVRQEKDLMDLIESHDRIFMLGHGSPWGLFFRHFQLGERFGPLLAKKQNGLYIWCHADAYAKRWKLSGLVSGMFISEVGEARMNGITATQKQVNKSNEFFAQTVRDYLETGALPSTVRQCYDNPACQVTTFNHDRLYVFQNGEATPPLHPSSRGNEPEPPPYVPLVVSPATRFPSIGTGYTGGWTGGYGYGGYSGLGGEDQEPGLDYLDRRDQWTDDVQDQLWGLGIRDADLDDFYWPEIEGKLDEYFEQGYTPEKAAEALHRLIKALRRQKRRHKKGEGESSKDFYLEGQDDLAKLPIPAVAKRYQRRSGLAAMKRQPQDFINVMAAVTNQKSRQHGFKNKDAAGHTPHAIKEEAALAVRLLVEDPDDDLDYKDIYATEKREFRVRPTGTQGDLVDYEFEVPPYGDIALVNRASFPVRFDFNAEIKAVVDHMAKLAKYRNFPKGSQFVTPFGNWTINPDKTITRI